jgi:hypothetical protein
MVEFQLFDDEAFPLEPRENLSCQTIMDRIGFEKCESSLRQVGQRPFSLLP